MYECVYLLNDGRMSMCTKLGREGAMAMAYFRVLLWCEM
jgi:hypothetical protein